LSVGVTSLSHERLCAKSAERAMEEARVIGERRQMKAARGRDEDR
jgi:hypothetical protein